MKPGTSEAGAGLFGRTSSIARRLALLHIFAGLISYTLFGVLFYAKRVEQRQQSEARELADEVISVRTMMRQPNGREILQSEMLAQKYEAGSSRMYIRVVDPRGATLMETPGMAGTVPPAAFVSPHGATSFGTFKWRGGNGDYFILKSARLPDGLFCGSGCAVQLATSANELVHFQSQLRWTLVFFVCGGVFFAFLCAYFIVRLGLKPLEEISRTARSITRRDLDTRISENNLPVELVSLAQSFNSMLARLEHSFESLSHYSANLAHELRTPINTLMIAADIALSRERSAEEYRVVLSSSLNELGRMSNTIDRMLFLARADIEQPDLALQQLDAASEIESLFDYYSDSAAEAGITLQTSGAATIYADQTLFRRALSNLINNSLAYTPSGGSVEVAFRAAEGGGVQVVVRDTGCGIEEEYLPKILNRFYRVPGDKSPGGSGLGLAIVKAIMQMHGGSIVVQSQPARWTEVTLTFPPQPVSPI